MPRISAASRDESPKRAVQLSEARSYFTLGPLMSRINLKTSHKQDNDGLQDQTQIFRDVCRKGINKYFASQQYSKKYCRDKYAQRMISAEQCDRDAKKSPLSRKSVIVIMAVS